MTKITVSLQDPLAAAIVADSAVHKLQEYITDYRTRKAKQDYDFQLSLCEQYKKEYFEAQQEYAKFADANRNVILQTDTERKEYNKKPDFSRANIQPVYGTASSTPRKITGSQTGICCSGASHRTACSGIS